MSARSTGPRVRLAELVAMISLGTDLGMGQPMEHVMRQSLIALRLAERLGLDEKASGRLLRRVDLLGRVSRRRIRAGEVVGDDMALKGDARQVDLAGKAARAFIMSHVGAGR